MAARFSLIEYALEEETLARRRRRWHLREKFNLNLVPDLEFIANYRLSRGLFEELCQKIVPLLRPKRNVRGIDPTTKILTALNFYARGSYQGAVGLNADAPMAQQTVSRCLLEVTSALNAPNILSEYIKFPQNLNERNIIKRKFFDYFGFPGVIGCIDCTHIAIVRPNENEERFFNRKHFHSLNVQIIGDYKNYITNVDASYGGATHDAFIWSHSEIKGHLESLHGETVYLLGDSGYHLREYLMKPIENVNEDSPEGRYNKIHKRVRSTIENTFGILKGRWRCLLAARELHYCPQTAGKITVACCVLHNMCIRAGLEAPGLTEEDTLAEHNRQAFGDSETTSALQALQRGRIVRNELVQVLERNRYSARQ